MLGSGSPYDGGTGGNRVRRRSGVGHRDHVFGWPSANAQFVVKQNAVNSDCHAVIGAGVEGIGFIVLGLDHAFPADGEVLAWVGVARMYDVGSGIEGCRDSRTGDLAGAVR